MARNLTNQEIAKEMALILANTKVETLGSWYRTAMEYVDAMEPTDEQRQMPVRACAEVFINFAFQDDESE